MIAYLDGEVIAYRYTGRVLYYKNKPVAGIPRKVDPLGRIVVPVEYRREAHMYPGEEIEITDIHRTAFFKIQVARRGCVLCKQQESLVCIGGRSYCPTCLNDFLMGLMELAESKNDEVLSVIYTPTLLHLLANIERM